MLRTITKIAVLLLAVILLSGSAVSMAVYGSVDPCTMLAEERTRRARDAAEEDIGADTGPRTLQEAAEEARDVAGRAAGDVERATTEAEGSVPEDSGARECARELWSVWF